MLFYFFALLAAAVVLLANDIRSRSNRWAAFFLVFAAIGGLADTIDEAGMHGAARGIQFLNLTVTPYGVLLFALTYAGLPERNRRRYKMLAWLLLLPVPLMLVAGLKETALHMDYWLLLLWSGPYYLAACWQLVTALLRERDAHRRRNRFVTTVIIVPTLLAVLAFIYVARAVAPDFPFFDYVSLFVFYSLAAGLLLAFVYGVLGVKLRLERDPLESAMQAASSGTTLLNHTIKNEIGKIAISAENMRHTLPELTDEASREAQQHLQVIERAADHMLGMVGRIHSQTREVVLREQPVRLDELAASVAEEHRERANRLGIEIGVRMDCRPIVICDPVHIREALGNLIANAIEAMHSSGGRMEVRLDAGKRDIRITVEDNGAGMTRVQAERAFEPFYSTKNGSGNFGLGLAYVYNVMRTSGGSAALMPREGGGTSAMLAFSPKKVIELEGGPKDVN
ncbi:sensor histidine kinase [Paenibacillus sp. strain BS8-2]